MQADRGRPGSPPPPGRPLPPPPGRPIPQPPPDRGERDPALAATLAALAGTAPGAAAFAVRLALLGARLLVPVVAVLDELEPAPEQAVAAAPRREKASHMAAATWRRADGRSATLAFTGVDPLAAWRPDARPVVVSAGEAARAALAEGHAALLLDVAGPVPYAVEGSDLAALAEGLGPPADLTEAVATALARHPVIAAHGLLAGAAHGPAVVWVRPAEGVDPHTCAAAAGRALHTCSDVAALAPAGLDIAVAAR